MIITYESTRDQSLKNSPSQGILEGISSDGGLYVVRGLKNMKVNLEEMVKKDYLTMGEEILSLFLGDFTKEEIRSAMEKAYDQRFTHEEITPLIKLKEGYVLELFHGPTSAFKDVALALLPKLMEEALKKTGKKEEIVILTATSGDTGKAALEGFKDADQIRMMVFYP
ncbi:MAG: threonine synthase, partial [Clostridiales bacterium]|nr:threonine synthase [Clostridiales bacterium]